jgi:hypothetical protein
MSVFQSMFGFSGNVGPPDNVQHKSSLLNTVQQISFKNHCSLIQNVQATKWMAQKHKYIL